MTTATSTPSAATRLEAQTRRHADLSRRLSTLVGQRDAEARALEEVRAEAMAEFGVSDLNGLRALLDASLRENEALIAEFTEALDTVERGTTSLEALLKA